MAKNIYLTSLGTLVKSDISKSISAFATILEQESSFPYFSTARINGALFVDKIYYKTIDNYKLGYLNNSEFKTKISDQLGIKESTRFEPAWKAMCELSEEASTKIIRLFQQQQTENFKLCIVSATNPLQYYYVMDQMNRDLENAGLPMLDENSDVTIATSFEEHTLSLAELARTAIGKNGWDSTQYTIVSYDDRLTKESLNLENAEFIYDSGQALLNFAGEL